MASAATLSALDAEYDDPDWQVAPHPCPRCGGLAVLANRWDGPASLGGAVVSIMAACTEGCGWADETHPRAA